jgi:hypothetical protein
MVVSVLAEDRSDPDSIAYIPDLVPDIASTLAEGELIDKQHVEEEIDLILRTLREMWNMEPDQVMRMSSALSSRATELAVHLHRAENAKGPGRLQWKQIRTLQIGPVIAELDRQFRVASRIVELRRQDLASL